MNKAITDGLALTPPPFKAGLGVWSSEDGTPGSATYQDDARAALVAADQDFGGALELTKTEAVQRLRYTGQTPILPGCYLRITARVKAISGNLPSVRIAGWLGDTAQQRVTGLVETGAATTLTSYGEVVEVTAIAGSGSRGGVDMVWGREPVYAHFGPDLTGPSGGVVRIDDLEIEDITGAYLRDMMDWVDVRDFGAVGDGISDDLAAFQAADAAAAGRGIVVPPGTYLLSDHLTLTGPARFDGTVSMAADKRLILRRNFDLPAYIDAFGDEVEGFRRAVQALLNGTDHESLDMGGRRIELDAPIDVAGAVGSPESFEIRRVIRNGQFNVQPGPGWQTGQVASQATYSAADPRTLRDVGNVANIEIGSLVTGTGVGREVYVRARNVAAGTLTLSQPLWGAAASQSYTFTRFRYVLDFSGFAKLSKFTLRDIEFQMDGLASGILLAPEGETFHVKDCFLTKPRDRGITSIGRGCQDLQVDRCHFISAEQSLPATARVSLGFNVNANDAKIRSNRFQRMGTTMVLAGNGHLLVGNHWFQGDNVTDGPRTPGLVLTETNVKSVVAGNYLDNSFLEWTNEHDAAPGFADEYSFGGLSITGNIFTANDVATYFRWIVIKPHGPGHFLQGLSVTGNTFKALNGPIGRVEAVDGSIAGLDMGRARLIAFHSNTFNGVDQETINPATLEFTQADPAQTWTLDPGAYLPFDGWTRTVAALSPEGELTTAGAQVLREWPAVTPQDRPGRDRVRLGFSVPVRGTVQMTVRMDKPF
ncbi:MAG: glycosyl hydrolase family 28-related protein [Tranquillimonas sp.]